MNGVSGNDSDNCKSVTTACKTIGHAISLASSADFVVVAPATYTENLTIGLSLTITGSAAKTKIVDGRAVNTVVTISNADAKVTLSNLTIRNGSADWGGGIYNNGILVVNNSVLSGNLSKGKLFRGGQGGGIINWGTLKINNTILSGNAANGPSGGVGGGIYNDGTAIIIGSILNANTTAGSGGGIYSPGGNLTIKQTTFSGNNAGVQGGGIDSDGVLTINNSTFSGNVSGIGGAITNGGTAIINNSTLTANSADNSAGGAGGAIINGGNLKISSSTLSLNKSGSGGGIYGSLGSVTLQNTILASNSGGNCYGTMTSNGYNLSSDSTCSFSGAGDMQNTIPCWEPCKTMADRHRHRLCSLAAQRLMLATRVDVGTATAIC